MARCGNSVSSSTEEGEAWHVWEGPIQDAPAVTVLSVQSLRRTAGLSCSVFSPLGPTKETGLLTLF